MLVPLINFTAMLLIVGMFLRWIEGTWPNSGVGKSLAFLY